MSTIYNTEYYLQRLQSDIQTPSLNINDEFDDSPPAFVGISHVNMYRDSDIQRVTLRLQPRQASETGIYAVITANLHGYNPIPHMGKLDPNGSKAFKITIGNFEDCIADNIYLTNNIDEIPYNQLQQRLFHTTLFSPIPHQRGIIEDHTHKPTLINTSQLTQYSKLQQIHSYEHCPRHYKSYIFKPSIPLTFENPKPQLFLIKPNSSLISCLSKNHTQEIDYKILETIYCYQQVFSKFLGMAILDRIPHTKYLIMLKDSLLPVSMNMFQKMFWLVTSYKRLNERTGETHTKRFTISWETFQTATNNW